jgi:thymidylate synthase (FAD)
VKFIRQPSATVIASTLPNAEALAAWAREHGFGEIMDDYATPLHSIVHDQADPLERVVEFAGRHCYRSFGKGREREAYIRNLLDEKHGSVFEHAYLTFAISGVSRSLTHELVRHRVGVAISQESQRYVDASEINFVVPPIMLFLGESSVSTFSAVCAYELDSYCEQKDALVEKLKRLNLSPRMFTKRANEAARSVLPNAAETRLTWTINLRSLIHFLLIRGQEEADLEIRRFAVELFHKAQPHAQITLSDFEVYEGDFGVPALRLKS